MKHKLCQFVIAMFLAGICTVLFGLSLLAVTSINMSNWAALDYWCAWFAFISFVGGAGTGIAAIVWFGGLLSDLCDGNRGMP